MHDCFFVYCTKSMSCLTHVIPLFYHHVFQLAEYTKSTGRMINASANADDDKVENPRLGFRIVRRPDEEAEDDNIP